MSESKQILLVAHQPSPNTQRLAEAIARGVQHEDIETVTLKHMVPLEAGPDDVLESDAVILFTTENLGYMSGALKDFFDRTYYGVLDRTGALPYALCIRAGHDGTGTRRAVDTILTGLRWRAVEEPLICRGEFQESFVEECEELGLYLAAGLDAGIF